MSRLFLSLCLLISSPAWAEFTLITGLGPDIQGSDNSLSPRGTYSNPDDQVTGGGSVVVYTGFQMTERFGLRTGLEFVSRFMKQDYDDWLSSNNGRTGYDAVTIDVPLYFDIFLGSSGRHRIYLGPKAAFTVYQHCEQSIEDPVEAYPCQDDGVKDVTPFIAAGYMFQITSLFGLTVFAEYSVLPIVDTGALEAKQGRSGVLATFFF